MDTGNETLDRIQQEIQEALEREEELRNKYSKLNSNPANGTNGYARDYGSGYSNGTDSAISSPPNSPHFSSLSNGSISPVNGSLSPINGDIKPFTNGAVNGGTLNGGTTNGTTNGARRFTPNPSAKGVMQKFLKMRGKLTTSSLKPARQSTWNVEDTFEPAKVTVEKGKPIRNGFVPAEEKMKKELQEFQLREDELRKERRKSQPDLMAALEAEQVESHLKPAKSLAQMYNSNENLLEDLQTPPASLRPSRSLAQLCDADDEELEMPGTHSLILQFEKLRTRNA